MSGEKKIEEIAAVLWKDPSEKNWELFAKSWRKSGVKYYMARFEKGKLKRMQDLRQSYVQLYDAKFKPVTRIPIFMNKNKKIIGATIYLKGLLVANLVG